MQDNLSTEILSEVTVYLKYARYLPDLKRRETWEEIVTRNTMMHLKQYPFLAEEIGQAYQFVFEKKVLPSMRSLQFAGKAIETNNTRLFNCSYLPIDDPFAFPEIMFLLLGGTGVGYSVQQHHIEKLPPIKKPTKFKRRYLVGDSIEGWAEATWALFKAYFYGLSNPIFDYSMIRPKGSPLRTAGGRAPGPEPLKKCLDQVREILDKKDNGDQLTSLEVHDIICFLSDAVLAGGIRRSALISLFSVDDEDMLKCKFGEWWKENPQRARSNNSAVLLRHRIKKEEFNDLWKSIRESNSGEPGIFFSNNSDVGSNPCMEIALKPFQFCNLTTINASTVTSQKDFNARAKAAAFIGTLQAGYTNFHFLRDIWRKTTEKECLLGVSLTGIASGNVLKLDLHEAAETVKQENERVAKLIGINKAARLTCTKPEGCQVKETMVVSNKGILELSEIGDIEGNKWQEHSLMVSTDKDQNISSKFFVNGYAKTKKINLDSGLSLESTLNHKYRVLFDGNYLWKEAKDIQAGDKILYRVGGYIGGENYKFNKIKFVRKNHDTHSKEILQPEFLDEDLAWFLGLYWGDGSTHPRSIRISCDVRYQDSCKKAANTILNKFGLKHKVQDYLHKSNDNRCQYYWNSVQLLEFMKCNDLIKPKSENLEIPLFIRTSPKSVIEAFLEGYAAADGCDKGNTRSFVSVSYKMAKQLVIILRAIGQDCKMRVMPPTDTSFGTSNRYWVSIRKGKKSNWSKQSKERQEYWTTLDKLGLTELNFDTVVSVEDSENDTFDIEVPETRTYISNSYVSHNTSSLVLGTSSGIHAWHSKYYIRRVRVLKNEPIYTYLKNNLPDLVEDDVLKPDRDGVISFPVKAPEGATFRDESALSLLERVKTISVGWVKNGHRKGDNTHNVSATVSVKLDEWKDVGEWMWENKNVYNGLSVLPFDESSYKQMPFEEITEIEYKRLLKYIKKLDLTEVKEEEDNTSLKEQVACQGGACEATL